jgi:hypothetical protein
LQPHPTSIIAGNASSLWATTRKQQPTQKKRRTTSTHHYGQSPVVAGIARHCGHCASLRALRVIAGNDPQTAAAKKRRTTHPTITDKSPSLRAMRVIAGIARHCGLRVIAGNDPQTAAAKKASNNPRPTSASVTPSLHARPPSHHYGQIPVVAGNARHCGQCASLRATTRNPPINSSCSKTNKKNK